MFKQQVSNDVVHALRAFEEAGCESSPEGEQPIGVYVERMRANLLERMQSLYVEQQRNLELDLGAQLAWQREALGQLPAEQQQLEGELRLAEVSPHISPYLPISPLAAGGRAAPRRGKG